MNAVLDRATAALDAAILTETGSLHSDSGAAPERGLPVRALPVNVYRKGNCYRVQLSVRGKLTHAGTAKTPDEAAKIARAVRKVAPVVRRCKPVKLEAAPCPQ